MNTNAEVDLPETPAMGKITVGKKQELGDCPICGEPLTNRYSVVRCTGWSCPFIEGLKEFLEGKHLTRVKEEAMVERNLVNIEKEERRRDKQFRAEKSGILSRLGLGRR